MSESEEGTSTRATQTEELSYEDITAVADYLRKRTQIRPAIGVICGSGLGGLGNDLDRDQPTDVIPYNEIPNFPKTTVAGHKGNLIFGYLSGKAIMCMQGRFHFYEGHPPQKITMPVRVMHMLGVKMLVVTNAAGGLNPDFKHGDIMLMRDHLNLCGMAGHNPLIGGNEDRFGPRFPAMSNPYDNKLRNLAKEVAKELDMDSFLREGVYCHLSGPSFETPFESRFLKLIGCDAVGMSTAPEVVVAKHCGMTVLGFSLITNMVILENDSSVPEPSHQEVMETGDRRAKDMQLLVRSIVDKYSLPTS